MKRSFILFLSLIIIITFTTPALAATTTKTIAKESDIYTFHDNLTAKQIVSDMKIGSNLAGYYDEFDCSFKTGYDKRTFASAPVGVAVWLYDDNWKNSAFEWLAYSSPELIKGKEATIKVLLKNSLKNLADGTKLNNITLGFRLANGKNAKVTATISNAYIKTSNGKKYNLDYFEGKRTFSNFTQDMNGNWFDNIDKQKISLPTVNTLKDSTLYATIKILDAPASEITKTGYWMNLDNSKTDSFELVDSLQKAGYDSIRLNVTWTPHMNDKTFVIDKEWLDAVQKIVDYSLKKDMYVILNSHYDYLGKSWVGDHWADDWMSEKYEVYVDDRFTKMWEQIATRFKKYGDKLLFEVANEMNEQHNTETSLERRVTRANSLNALFVQTVRSTGSNNTKRFLNIASVGESAENLEYLELPKDSRLMVQVHYYSTPSDIVYGWDEATNSVNHTLDKATWKWSVTNINDTQPIDNIFDKIKSFTDNTGIPVILGEWGSTEAYPLTDRISMAKYFLAKAKELNIPCFWWECGISSGDTSVSIFSLYDRNTKKWRQPKLLNSIMEAVES